MIKILLISVEHKVDHNEPYFMDSKIRLIKTSETILTFSDFRVVTWFWCKSVLNHTWFVVTMSALKFFFTTVYAQFDCIKSFFLPLPCHFFLLICFTDLEQGVFNIWVHKQISY